MHFLGKLLPVDGYRVELYESLPEDYRASLMHLYQPLIGADSIGLYQLLLEETKLGKPETIHTHHTLMNYLNQALNRIYDARLKLEAIGLLQTFRLAAENQTIFTYRIIAPFRPAAFFDDMMLAELLFHHLGETRFASIKNRYSRKTLTNHGESVTASFKDVFTTINPVEQQKITSAKMERQQGISLEKVDFGLLQNMLQQKKIPVEKVLTEGNKKNINQLMQMYELEMYEMEKALLWGLTDENELDITQFKAACHDLFLGKNNHVKVELTEKQIKEPVKKQGEKISKQAELVLHLEKISPKRLLEDLSGGQNASEQEMQMIRDMMMEQGLPTPVMNVAIYYVMLQTNMKLAKPYLEKIATHWSRLKFTTAKEAMDYVLTKKEPKMTQKRNYTPSYKNQPKEIIPDWFNDRNKANPANKKPEPSLAENEEQEMIALLKRHASKNG